LILSANPATFIDMTRVLAIESSCDETALALVEGEGNRVKIVKSLVASQVELHKKYGGVVPEVAARQHVQTAALMLKDSGIKPDDFDVIAVTSGPGLITALRVGLDTAKALSWSLGKPLIGVNHIEGHVYANWIEEKSKVESQKLKIETPEFPALALIVSGGHTELVLMKNFGEYERLGETLDDAVGEAFDKVAKILGLAYPGGPEVSKRAERGSQARFAFPRPLIHDPALNFSYSGLKTAVRIEVTKLGKPSEADLNDVCASFQAAAVEPLIAKTELAIRKVGGVKSLLLAGGVSANSLLRGSFAKLGAEYQLPVFLPELKLTGDNAAMIAAAGYFRRAEASNDSWKTTQANANWRLGL